MDNALILQRLKNLAYVIVIIGEKLYYGLAHDVFMHSFSSWKHNISNVYINLLCHYIHFLWFRLVIKLSSLHLKTTCWLLAWQKKE